MGGKAAALLLLLVPLASADYPAAKGHYPAAKGHSSYGKGGGGPKYKIEPAGPSEEFKWAGPGYHVSVSHVGCLDRAWVCWIATGGHCVE